MTMRVIASCQTERITAARLPFVSSSFWRYQFSITTNALLYRLGSCHEMRFQARGDFTMDARRQA